jgi:hypothetical protein
MPPPARHLPQWPESLLMASATQAGYSSSSSPVSSGGIMAPQPRRRRPDCLQIRGCRARRSVSGPTIQESPRPGGRQQAAGELALQQPDGVEDDGQHRDDPGGAVMPEAQHHEDHDPGVRHAFITAAQDAGVPLRAAARSVWPRTIGRQAPVLARAVRPGDWRRSRSRETSRGREPAPSCPVPKTDLSCHSDVFTDHGRVDTRWPTSAACAVSSGSRTDQQRPADSHAARPART